MRKWVLMAFPTDNFIFQHSDTINACQARSHVVTVTVKGSHLKKYLKLLSILKEEQMKLRM